MIAQEVGRKYGRALFMSVKAKKLLDQADAQFLMLKQVLATDRSLLNFLAAPQVPDPQKTALIRTVFGKRMEEQLVEFLLVVVEKHRANFLPEIVDEFDRLVKAEKGIGKVTVITAVPLSETEERTLIGKLTGKLHLKIELDKRIDPAILGGMIVITHDQIIDGSVRHGLDLIQEQLEKVKVA